MVNGIDDNKVIWFCPNIFIDNSWCNFVNHKFLLLGAIITGVDSLLSVELGKIRQNEKFVYELHFSEMRAEDKFNIAKKFLDAFYDDDKSFFRAIIVEQDEDANFFSNRKNWKFLANTIRFLLQYKYLVNEKKTIIFKRPRLFIDEISENFKQKDEFKKYLKKSLRIQEFFNGPEGKIKLDKIPEAPINISIDSKSLDCVQLVDILLGAIHNDMIPIKDKYKDQFVDYLKQKFKITTNLYNVARWRTPKEKINIWDFKQKFNIYLRSQIPF